MDFPLFQSTFEGNVPESLEATLKGIKRNEPVLIESEKGLSLFKFSKFIPETLYGSMHRINSRTVVSGFEDNVVVKNSKKASKKHSLIFPTEKHIYLRKDNTLGLYLSEMRKADVMVPFLNEGKNQVSLLPISIYHDTKTILDKLSNLITKDYAENMMASFIKGKKKESYSNSWFPKRLRDYKMISNISPGDFLYIGKQDKMLVVSAKKKKYDKLMVSRGSVASYAPPLFMANRGDHIEVSNNSELFQADFLTTNFDEAMSHCESGEISFLAPKIEKYHDFLQTEYKRIN